MPLTIHLTSSAGVVTGTVEGLPTTPAEIHEGKLDGDTVSFWLNTDYQGQTYKLTLQGQNFGRSDRIHLRDRRWNLGHGNDGDKGDVEG